MLPVRVLQSCVDEECSSPLTAWSRLPRLFDQMFENDTWPVTATVMPVDIRKAGEQWVIQAEVPGMKPDSLNITVENGVLTISGKHASEAEKEGAEYLVRERRTGELSRSFCLPETADTDKVGAELSNGVLTLTIPTREEAKPRRIEVK